MIEDRGGCVDPADLLEPLEPRGGVHLDHERTLPTFEEVHKGTAQVRQVFSVPKVGVIAGCHVVDGVIPRSASVRLLRDNVVVYEGKIASLRRFKDDASEVRSGFDCGIGLERFQDVKPGDEIEAFAREEVAAVL